MPQPDQPNILFLQFDQLKANACSPNGNSVVPTRFMDRMAASGVTFRNAYSPSPICTPSRASVMTGVHPLVHGVTCHQNRAPVNLKQLPEFLSDAGYVTAAVGHYEAHRSLTRGWHEQISHDEPSLLSKALHHWYGHGRTDVAWSSGTLEGAAEDGHAHRLTNRALTVVDGICELGSPYFLHVPYLEPHPPYFIYPPYDKMVDPRDVVLPDPGTDAGRPAWLRTLRDQSGSDQATEEDLRRMLATYYGMAAYVDDQMDRLWRELEGRGLLENTWIIIGSDHGDFAAEKGLAMKCECLYECLLHVPLVIVPPDGAPQGTSWPRGEVVDELVDLTDLFPTILSMAGVPIPEYTQGRDLLGWIAAGADGGAGGDRARTPIRDTVYAQVGDYHGGLKTTLPSGMAEVGRHPGIVRCGRSTTASYIRDPDYGDEAYDLKTDPAELDDLLSSTHGDGNLPEHVAAVRDSVDEWDRACRELRKELGVVPGYRGFDGE